MGIIVNNDTWIEVWPWILSVKIFSTEFQNFKVFAIWTLGWESMEFIC